MDSILLICDTYRKTKRVYCYLICQAQNPSTISQNYSPVTQDHHLKMMTQHSKNATFLSIESCPAHDGSLLDFDPTLEK